MWRVKNEQLLLCCRLVFVLNRYQSWLMRQVLLTLSSLAQCGCVQCDSIRFNKWMHMCFYALSVGTKWKECQRNLLYFRFFSFPICSLSKSYAWIDIHSHRKYCFGHSISFNSDVKSSIEMRNTSRAPLSVYWVFVFTFVFVWVPKRKYPKRYSPITT